MEIVELPLPTRATPFKKRYCLNSKATYNYVIFSVSPLIATSIPISHVKSIPIYRFLLLLRKIYIFKTFPLRKIETMQLLAHLGISIASIQTFVTGLFCVIFSSQTLRHTAGNCVRYILRRFKLNWSALTSEEEMLSPSPTTTPEAVHRNRITFLLKGRVIRI